MKRETNEDGRRILLFDIDGTLTPCGKKISEEMIEVLREVYHRNNGDLGLVGGGTYGRILEQMGPAISYFKYIFAECGSVVYVDGFLFLEKNMLNVCDRDRLNLLIKRALIKIAEMPILHHGNPIDFRKGLVNISPPGMQATSYERNIFLEKDREENLRRDLLADLRQHDPDRKFEICLGGAVGIAIYPPGWDKSQVVDFFLLWRQDRARWERLSDFFTSSRSRHFCYGSF
jgi:phosphomannomutase